MTGRVAFLILAGAVATAFAADIESWPQFRGANHDYSTSARALPQTWSATENIAWKTPIAGSGWASPVIWRDKVFIATAIQEVAGKDTAPPPNYNSERIGADSIYRWELHCLELESGKELWKQIAHRGNPRVRTHPQNTYASETPVTDGERVYVYFGMIGLFCYDLDGNLVWKKDLGGYTMLGDWGTGSSPILHDGKLYLQIDSEDKAFLAAFDAATGAEVWGVERTKGSSWSTPYIWRNSLRTELVTNAQDVGAYDPATGELFWSLRYPGGRASASPVGNDDALIVGNERRADGGGVILSVKAGAAGDITPAPGSTTSEGVLWWHDDGGPEFASPLLYDGHVYVFGRNRGSIACFDAKTGALSEGLDRIPGARSFWSSPWAHEGKIFCTDEAGTTYVVLAAPNLELLGENRLGEEVRASPAIVERTIVMRAENHVYCVRP